MPRILLMHLCALSCTLASPTTALYAQQGQGGTLPEVVVEPETRTVPSATYSNQPYGFPGGGIPWNSNAIRSDRDLVGPYNQPVWTTQRPWATTRVYVLPPGQAQVEQWVRPTWPMHGLTEFRFLEEFAIGLPGRFQLDIYERWNVEPNDADRQQANHEGVQLELRYALADWGVIPLNPTLYIEWVERGGRQEKPNVYEAKLLLGDEIFSNVFYATNLILEQETSGHRATELSWSHAVSSTIIERRLLMGLETLFISATDNTDRIHGEISMLAGPSLQYRPTNRTFIDVVGLFGTTSQSAKAQMYVVAGYQFGRRAGPSVAPVSTIGN